MTRRSSGRVLALALGILVLVAGWLFLWPTQLGGRTSYAVIVGSSMEPLLHRGDLAVVRTQEAYTPGAVVLYDNKELGAKVLHRVVRLESGRYVLKGDNNTFIDSERPVDAQVVGRLWFHVPNVGLVTEWVRVPGHAALIVGLATLLALGGGVGVGAATRRPRPSGAASSSSLASLDPLPLLVVLGATAAAFALLAAVAFGRPETRVASVPEAYAQRGAFEYGSDVHPSAAYPNGHVTTGDPIFLRLVERLRIGFDYTLESAAPASGAGRIRLDASLSDGRGWVRVLPLAPARSFTGTHARADGTIDLRRLQRLIEDVRALTGSAQIAYTLTVAPRVTRAGRAGGETLESVFAPKLTFDLGDLRLEPKLDSGDGVSPFAPREPVAGTRVVGNAVSFGALSLPVSTARPLSLIGLGAAALLALLTIGPLLGRRQRSESELVAARFGRLVLPISSLPREWSRVTDVADLESLARLAEHYDRVILSLDEAGGTSYLVEESGTVYRHREGAPLAPEPAHVLPTLDTELASAVRAPAPEGPAGALIPGGNGRRYGSARASRRLLGAHRGRVHEDW
jgi:signal peptidase I